MNTHGHTRTLTHAHSQCILSVRLTELDYLFVHEFIDDHFTHIIHIYYSYFEKFINSACIRKKQGSKMVDDDSAVFAGAN